MKKEILTEKLARKSFESTKIQKSWQVHMQAFGPILEPAFVEDYQARLYLTSALNYISKHKVKEGFNKLQLVKKDCITGADKAAYLFCMGLCFEMANMKDEVLSCYQQAAEYGHSFYLPYLKVAKMAHNDAVFESAEENYVQAIKCLKMGKLEEREKFVLGSVYTNYASCLTMMHRYEEAEEALRCSYEILPEQKERTVAEAILEAAKGNEEKAYSFIDLIAAQEPTFYETTSKMVNDILHKQHPHFAPIALPEGCIRAFWDWFVSNETSFLRKLDAEDYDAVFRVIQTRLKEVFPFMKRDMELGIEPRENFYQITFADFFMVSLEQGYKELIEAVPQSLVAHWGFDIAH